MCRCGTFVVAGRPAGSSAGAVPLTGVAFDVRVLDFCTEVTLRQRFINAEAAPIEATFDFVLDDGASVTRFVARVADKEIVASLKEKEQARNTYDDALASGSGAYLLERSDQHKDAFRVSVGALPPREEVLVELTYVTEAEALPGEGLGAPATGVRVRIPGGTLTLGAAPAFSKFGSLFPSPFSVRSTFDMSSTIKGVTSPSHQVSFSWSDVPFGAASCRAVVTHTADSAPPDRDFVLEVALSEPNKSFSRVARTAAGDAVAMLTFCPNLRGVALRTELLFLVDRSGSMGGAPMTHVKATMQLLLRSMRVGTLFNIIGFGSTFQKLFPSGSREYNDASLAEAIAHVASMDANLGGTNVHAPLMNIFGTAPLEGTPRQIFLLTDGDVENRDTCIEAVRKHAGTTRVFTFGIGAGADTFLVHGIATAGEGKCELIADSSNLSPKVMRQMASAMQPAVSNLSLSWGAVSAKQTPFILPPLFNGNRMIVYGLLDPGARAGPVTLTAKSGSQTITETVQVDPAAALQSADQGRHIVQLAARSAIRDLEENRSWLGSATETKEAERQIVALSLKHGVLSKHTAFVAVEKRSGAASDQSMRQRAVVLGPKQQQQQQLQLQLQQQQLQLQQQQLQQHQLQHQQQQQYQQQALFGGYGGAPQSYGSRSLIGAPTSHLGGLPCMGIPMGGMGMPGMAMPPVMGMAVPFGAPAAQPMMAPQATPSFSFGAAPAMNHRSAPAPASQRSDHFCAVPAGGFANSSVQDILFGAPKGFTPAPAIDLNAIIAKQTASGYWPTDSVCLIGTTWDALSKALPPDAVGRGSVALIWVTRVIVEFIKLRFPARSDEWCLIVDKAIAWAEAEERRSPAGVSRLRCPKGHALQLHNVLATLTLDNPNYNHGYSCDACTLSKTDMPVMHCKDCQYDLCPGCAPKCPSGHPFSERSVQQLASQYPGYATGFVCDTCATHIKETTAVSVHCDKCNYDMCPVCFARSAAPTTQGATPVNWAAAALAFAKTL